MTVLRDFSGWPRGPLHLAIGVFDGVHRGHRALVARLREGASAAGATSLAATFDPLPIHVLAPGAPPSALSEVDERAALLRAAGAEAVVVLRFDAAFASLSAAAFVARLAGAGDVRRIVLGPDFRFGHGREGDLVLLGRLAPAHGFAVEVFPPLEHGGEVVSSTRVRNLLLAGDVQGASDLLGRDYSVRGSVVHGDQRGRSLGFPTINIAPPPERILPRDGIYATWAGIDGARHRAATSLGLRPTFGGVQRRLECFLLDFVGDLYGREVTVTFVTRLRDEVAFPSGEALAAQIAKDVEATRSALG